MDSNAAKRARIALQSQTAGDVLAGRLSPQQGECPVLAGLVVKGVLEPSPTGIEVLADRKRELARCGDLGYTRIEGPVETGRSGAGKEISHAELRHARKVH